MAPTCLGEYNPFYLVFGEACTLKLNVPWLGYWATLDYPEDGENQIGAYQDGKRGLKGSYPLLAERYAQEKEADGHFGPHQGRESLDPLAPGVLLEFAELMFGEILLVPSKSFVGLDKIQRHPNGSAELRWLFVSLDDLLGETYNSHHDCVIIPAKSLHNLFTSGNPQSYHRGGAGCWDDCQDDDTFCEVGIARLGWCRRIAQAAHLVCTEKLG